VLQKNFRVHPLPRGKTLRGNRWGKLKKRGDLETSRGVRVTLSTENPGNSNMDLEQPWKVQGKPWCELLSCLFSS